MRRRWWVVLSGMSQPSQRQASGEARRTRCCCSSIVAQPDSGNVTAVCRHSPLTASQTLSVLSDDPESRRAPSGLHAHEVTCQVCPQSVSRHSPLTASQTLSVLSHDPESRLAPSGLHAHEETFPAWPEKGTGPWRCMSADGGTWVFASQVAEVFAPASPTWTSTQRVMASRRFAPLREPRRHCNPDKSASAHVEFGALT